MLLLVGCTPDTDDEENTSTEADVVPGIVVSSASWRLDWTMDDTEPGDDGWSTTTDLGYRVTVERGWVVAYSVTLSPCIEETAYRTDRSWSLLGVGTAHADHPDFEDPSQVEMVQAQSLSEPTVWSTETTFEPGTYCGLHHLVARGEADSISPDGDSAFGYSLQSAVRWTKDDQEGGFTLASDWANGRDWTWDDVVTVFPENGEAPESWHADIVLRRNPSRLFDGIELSEATDGQVIWAMLESLFENASITVTFRAS